VNSLLELIAQPDVVVPELGAITPEEAITLLQQKIAETTTAVSDSEQLLAALLERYRVTSVAIGPDVALPHARTDAVDRVVLAFGRSSRGIAFDAAHPQVRLVFLIATPRKQITEYLQAVAALSRWLKGEGTRTALLAARDEEELRAPFARAMKVAI
jgi:mannitol/fructose-specific phosphotransferase system IIA component (Ntr-type)